MFYNEQLSVLPREKSMEEKSRTIRDIIMKPLHYEDKQSLSIGVATSSVASKTPENNQVPGFVMQAEVRQGNN